MKHSTAKPTAAEAERLEAVHALPCLACMMALAVQRQRTEAHHQLSGGVRIGHEATIPLCGWHHRGERPNRKVTNAQMTKYSGPSLALSSKAFHDRFGTDAELLNRTNKLIGRIS
jgi:Recombination enhancement, RecA-dependent nuclease